MDEKLYTADEVAALFNVKRITVWDWIRKGKLRAYKCGGRLYRISEKHISAFKKKYGYEEA